MTHKIAGACTACDEPCFEVMQVFEAHERYPGEPKALGKPFQDALRVTFLLMDGTKTYLTFCERCADSHDYIETWRKNMRTWQRELNGESPTWFLEQFHNGLLREVARAPWKAING